MLPHYYNCCFLSFRVVKINPDTNAVSEVCKVISTDLSQYGNLKWGCGALGSDGCIYCAPWDCKRVLRIDPRVDSVIPVGPTWEELGSPAPGWIGAVADGEGNVYMVPHNASKVLKVIPNQPRQKKKDAPPPQLILTPKGSLDQCVFADATIAALKAGKPAKLTLNSHSGAAIGKKYEEEHRVSYVKKSLRFRPSLRLFS